MRKLFPKQLTTAELFDLLWDVVFLLGVDLEVTAPLDEAFRRNLVNQKIASVSEPTALGYCV